MKWWERFVPVVMFGVTLVLITAVLMPHYDSGKGHAKTDAARMDLGQLKEGLERFRMDVGRYPTVAEGLGALLKDSDVAPWHGPYWKPDGSLVKVKWCCRMIRGETSIGMWCLGTGERRIRFRRMDRMGWRGPGMIWSASEGICDCREGGH